MSDAGQPDVLLSIVIPCFREEKNIPELMMRVTGVMEKQTYPWEIILVEDGSPDHTWAQIERYTGDPRIRGIRHEKNQGIVIAWETGLINARGIWVVTLDADMQYAPEDIPALVEEMQTGKYDLVQGVRIQRFESRYRAILSIVFSDLLKLLFSLPFEDIKSGFILYKREAFFQVMKWRHSFRLFQHWTIIAAHSMGLKIRQIPTTFYPRKAGESFITSPIAFGFKALLEVPKAVLCFRIRKGTAPPL